MMLACGLTVGRSAVTRTSRKTTCRFESYGPSQVMYDEHAQGAGWQDLDLDKLIEKQLAEIREKALARHYGIMNQRSELRLVGR